MVEAALRLGFSLGTFMVVAGAECIVPRRRLADPRRRRWPVNLGIALVNSAILRAVGGGAVVSAAVFAAERGAGLLHWVSLPPWMGWAISILALDFAVYLQHVMFHSVPVFWRLHRIHHADLGFDTSTGVRFHPIEILLSAGLKSAVVVLLGATPWAVVAFEILLNATSLFNHGNVFIPERVDAWLRRVVVTPDMHRIHHSSEVVETNSNFGFSFSFWDRLCGTYRREPRLGQLGLEIGLSEFREPLGFGEVLLLPFKARARTTIGPRELERALLNRGEVLVLDVRGAEEFHGVGGHVPGSVSVPVDQLPSRLGELEDWRTRLLVPV